MKDNNIIDKYIKNKLLDSSTIITEDLIHDDIDFNNIIGMHLLPGNRENFLGGEEGSAYQEYLDKFMLDYFDLFFYSDIEHGHLYFECLLGSKSDINKKYQIKKSIYQIENDNCPTCRSKLKIKLLGNKPTHVDGTTEICYKFLIYCPICNGRFGIYGFKTINILKSLYYDTIKFFKSIESMKVVIGLPKIEGNIQLKSNFDAKYRC